MIWQSGKQQLTSCRLWWWLWRTVIWGEMTLQYHRCWSPGYLDMSLGASPGKCIQCTANLQSDSLAAHPLYIYSNHYVLNATTGRPGILSSISDKSYNALRSCTAKIPISLGTLYISEWQIERGGVIQGNICPALFEAQMLNLKPMSWVWGMGGREMPEFRNCRVKTTGSAHNDVVNVALCLFSSVNQQLPDPERRQVDLKSPIIYHHLIQVIVFWSV